MHHHHQLFFILIIFQKDYFCQVLNSFTLIAIHVVCIIISILWMRKLRLREGKYRQGPISAKELVLRPRDSLTQAYGCHNGKQCGGSSKN